MMPIYSFPSYFEAIYRMAQYNTPVKFGQFLPIFMSIGLTEKYEKNEPSILLEFIAQYDRSCRNIKKTHL